MRVSSPHEFHDGVLEFRAALLHLHVEDGRMDVGVDGGRPLALGAEDGGALQRLLPVALEAATNAR